MRISSCFTLLPICLIGAAAQAAQPENVWAPSDEAPAGLLTPLEVARHDSFIRLAQTASSCSGAPLTERCTPGGIDIVFFGSTSTEMWWRPDRGMSVWEQAFGSRKAVNFGSQGTRPESLLWRMRNGELDGYRANLVVLQAFSLAEDMNGAEVATLYAPIIAEIRARQPDAKILIFDAPRRGSVSAANATVHAEIVDNQTVFYAGLPEQFITDRKGYEAWAAALEPWVEQFAG